MLICLLQLRSTQSSAPCYLVNKHGATRSRHGAICDLLRVCSMLIYKVKRSRALCCKRQKWAQHGAACGKMLMKMNMEQTWSSFPCVSAPWSFTLSTRSSALCWTEQLHVCSLLLHVCSVLIYILNMEQCSMLKKVKMGQHTEQTQSRMRKFAIEFSVYFVVLHYFQF